MRNHIRPVALKLGLPNISWHSFRHSASRWAKGALKKLEEAKKAEGDRMIQYDAQPNYANWGGVTLYFKKNYGVEFPIAAGRHVDVVPGVHVYVISRAGDDGSASSYLDLNPFAVRPGVNVRVRF